MLALVKVVEGGTIDYHTTITVNIDCVYEGLSKEKIRVRLITFGSNEVSTIEDQELGVIEQLINKHASSMVDVHCMTHCPNLVV